MKIEVNGKLYASLNEVPEPDRRLYEEAAKVALANTGGDGVADVLKGDEPGNRLVVRTTIRINGKTFGSLSEMPPEVRELHARTMKSVASLATGTMAPTEATGAQPPAPALTPRGLALQPIMVWVMAAAFLGMLILLFTR